MSNSFATCSSDASSSVLSPAPIPLTFRQLVNHQIQQLQHQHQHHQQTIFYNHLQYQTNRSGRNQSGRNSEPEALQTNAHHNSRPRSQSQHSVQNIQNIVAPNESTPSIPSPVPPNEAIKSTSRQTMNREKIGRSSHHHHSVGMTVAPIPKHLQPQSQQEAQAPESRQEEEQQQQQMIMNPNANYTHNSQNYVSQVQPSAMESLCILTSDNPNSLNSNCNTHNDDFEYDIQLNKKRFYSENLAMSNSNTNPNTHLNSNSFVNSRCCTVGGSAPNSEISDNTAILAGLKHPNEYTLAMLCDESFFVNKMMEEIMVLVQHMNEYIDAYSQSAKHKNIMAKTKSCRK